MGRARNQTHGPPTFRSTHRATDCRGLFAACKSVEREEFAACVASRDLASDSLGAQGLGFIQRVLRENLATFISAERADAAPDFAVQTAGNAPDLYVIKHIYPLERNRPAWGFDLGAEPVYRVAIERAVRTGEPTITGRNALVHDHETRVGFLQLLPVYQNGSNEIFEGDSLASETQLFDCDHHWKDAIGHDEYAERMFERRRLLSIGSRTWTLNASTTPKIEAEIDRSRNGTWDGW